MDGMASDQSRETTPFVKKCCVHCNATKTPLWRTGPAGPGSLCNACGIKYRKKRNMMETNNSSKAIKKDTTKAPPAAAAAPTTESSTSSDQGGGNGDGGGFTSVGRFLIQRQRSLRRKRSMRLGEAEQAAFLLMQLSSGYVFGLSRVDKITPLMEDNEHDLHVV